tara:strand:+ start:245 stop:364 length:120 start_codon:yes stop_codon:yes gene_type:complete
MSNQRLREIFIELLIELDPILSPEDIDDLRDLFTGLEAT